MRSRYIPAFVMLLAALVTIIISFVLKFDKSYTIKLLFVVLIIFYVIGTIAKKIIVRALTPKMENDEQNSEEITTVSKDNITEE